MQGKSIQTRYMYIVTLKTDKTVMSFIHTDVSEKLLSNDLTYVWRWYPLGIQLGVPDADLRKIECDFQHTEDRLIRMLSKWMRIDEQPSWSKVVRALVAINERHVARDIAEKYGKHIFNIGVHRGLKPPPPPPPIICERAESPNITFI